MPDNIQNQKEWDSINVVMYSYKSKDAIETLRDLMNKRSMEVFVFVHWHDQNGLDRSKLLEDLINSQDACNGDYFPIHWDNNEGAVSYRDNRLKVTFGGKYHMTITPGTTLEKNWDLNLINAVKDKRIVISGNKRIKLDNSKKFFVNKTFEPISDYTVTNYIDKNFIFGNVVMMKSSSLGDYLFPGWLKYYGDEEILSLQYFKDNIEIVAAPETVLNTSNYSTLEDFNYYVPFSKYHNYNEALRIFKEGHNHIVGAIDKEIIENFSKAINFDFSSLSYLPFPHNDVTYSVSTTSYDRLGGRRFIKPVNKVE
jgi:hypothetical protein